MTTMQFVVILFSYQGISTLFSLRYNVFLNGTRVGGGVQM